MAGLEIQIGADKSDFDKKIKEVEFDIKELSKEKKIQIKAGLDTTEITKNIRDAKKALSDLKTTTKDAGDSFSKNLAPKVANGGNALTQFSRIAQDAPFGIMGIGNNITATAEAFAHLKNETGSTGGALKAVASSMMGTGGILLAVSLVTTGLTYMAQNGLTVGDVFKKLTGDFDGTAKAMSDLNAEAAKNAQGEISGMNAYVSVAKDVNLSMEDRLIAVRKLQEEYPAYFGNLSKEQILNGNVAAAVKGVTSALIAKAKAAAAVGKIVDLAEKEEIIQEKINKAVGEMAKFYHLSGQAAKDFATTLNKQLTGQIDLIGELNKGNANNLSTSEKQALAAIQYSNTLQGLGVELRENIALQDKYTKKINENTAAQIKLETVVPKGAKTPKAKKTFETPQVAGIDSDLTTAGIKAILKEYEVLENGTIQVAANIGTSMKGINVALDTGWADAYQSMLDFNKQASEIITGGIVNTFAGIGEAIGSALASGSNVIDAVGKSILGSMGAMLSELGKATIAYGVGLIAVKAAIKNPYLAVAAGVAMVALGSAMSSAVSKSSSSALGGGGASGGGSPQTGASYRSPTQSITSGGGGTGGGTYVFEIEGTKLIGVLNNTLDKNKRLGGNLPIG